MDKQRLLELAGITEAGYDSPEPGFVVVKFEDGYFDIEGPFRSEEEATKYRRFVIQKFGLDDDEVGEVVQISRPHPK